ncbi:MAG: hypothetical protein ABI369_02985, partial [Acetobacteraceae bacterium]
MRPLLVHGMMGLGDNVHQRAIIRQLMERNEVWLETVWPSLYHDLVPAGLHLISGRTELRTQRKNAAREAALFSRGEPPRGCASVRISYDMALTRRVGVLPAMMASCGCDAATADFALPIPAAWRAKAARWLKRWKPTKPLMIYRPLIERTEWIGCPARNPDHRAYARLFDEIGHEFFVVSVADLMPGVEWAVGTEVATDAQCHAGELDIETLAALMSEAALVFCSPGFALVLGQAVGTRMVCVFGGFEGARHHVPSALYAPFLGIDPVRVCGCFRIDHACDKTINLDAALPRLRRFADAARRPDPGPRPSVKLPPRPAPEAASARFMPV